MVRKKEILIFWYSMEVHLVEVSRGDRGLPVLERWAVYPVQEGIGEDAVVESIRQTLFAGGFGNSELTLVIGGKETLMRVEDVAEQIPANVSGYAIQSVNTSFPAPGMELAASMFPLSQVEPGKVQVAVFGAKAEFIRSRLASFEKAGLAVNRILPETTGILQIIRRADPSWSGVTIQLQPDGAELVGWLNGRIFDFNWIPSGGGLELPDFLECLKAAVTKLSMVHQAVKVRFFGIKQDSIAEFFKQNTDFTVENPVGTPDGPEPVVQVYRADLDKNLPIPRSYSEAMVAAGFLPEFTGLMTSEMLEAAFRSKSNRVKFKLSLVLGGLLLGGLAALWIVSQVSHAASARMANAYEILKPRALQLEKIDTTNRSIKNQMVEWGKALMEEPEWLPVLSGIQAALPEGIYFTTVKLDRARGCILSGTAMDAGMVTSMAKSLIHVPTVRQVEIVYLKSRAGQGGVEFAIAFSVGKEEGKR